MENETKNKSLPKKTHKRKHKVTNTGGEMEQIVAELSSINAEPSKPTLAKGVPNSQNKVMSLVMKVFYGGIGAIALGMFVLIGMNIYEIANRCIIERNDGFILNGEINPVSCNPIITPTRSNSNNSDNIFGLNQRAQPMKPLILLYPEKEQDIQVELEYTPGFSATFPEYDTSKKGWSVTASPDGTLLDHTTGQETYGLFWEGNLTHANYNTSKGWVIKGGELREFLYEKLSEIGLNTKEKSDFIMFWYPKLQEYPYVQITFTGEDYNQSAPLKITPKPDSLLRVFMVAKPLAAPKKIEPQTLERFQRKGFSVVEWGGTIVGVDPNK
ncbi:hypothetical protein KBC86_00020 [Candidatus Gracilibacteria bacterium]|nr:hypothetical protein [Candidatus Gracilibacteria bacterium]